MFKDAVTDFAAKTSQTKIDKFIVAGASKRGWTTWLTMAVDKRVFAAIPIVMDMLSLNTVIKLDVPHFNNKFSNFNLFLRIFTFIIDH